MKENLSASVSNRREKWLVVTLFLGIWSYLIVRAFTVFYVHDEIVTKWTFMIDWNYLPEQGYIDANNHFLMSFLGGLFIRIFNSDAMIVVRLGALLCFPIYFWSLYGLRSFFRQKANFYAVFIGLIFTSFIIEYFAFARGYGISFAFMILALQQTLVYLRDQKSKSLIILTCAWVLAIAANLTLIPFALAGLVYVALFTIVRGSKWWTILPALALMPIAYLVMYSFGLKDLGKLYYGGSEGFFETTIHSLTPYIWNVKHWMLDAILSLGALFISVVLLMRIWKSRSIFQPNAIFPIFFVLAIANILGQHWLLDINYPSDRTALYLLIFFIGGLFFSIDAVTEKRIPAYIYIGLALVFFAFQANFNRSILHAPEHLSQELVTLIPKEVNGTPPSTAGRWCMENEMSLALNLPARMYQIPDAESDTLVDYLIYNVERRPSLLKLYKPIFVDEISTLTLFERRTFLPRKKTDESSVNASGNPEFLNLHVADLKKSMMLRCSGTLKPMDLYKDVHIIFSSEDTVRKTAVSYDAISLMQNTRADKNGNIQFDFTYAMNKLPGANKFAVYIWNKKRAVFSGKLKVEVYTIGDSKSE